MFDYTVRCREIIASKADIVCLQEVDRTVFVDFLQPALLAAGYSDAFLLEKSSSSREGIATFVRLDSGFRVDEYLAVSLGGAGVSNAERSETDVSGNTVQAVSSDTVAKSVLHWEESEALQQLAQQGTYGTETIRVLKSVSTKGQLVVLRRNIRSSTSSSSGTHEEEQVVIIGNTHLHYHPLCSHVRALQLEHFLSVVHDTVARIQDTSVAPAFVLCGDLNAQPSTSAGTYQD